LNEVLSLAQRQSLFGKQMIKKMTVLIGAAACTGLVVIFVLGFARGIAAGVMPFGKTQLGIEDSNLVISPPDITCRRDPWPYGCDWRASVGRKHFVKEVRTRHHSHALITVR
jgi:hypothetical protein